MEINATESYCGGWRAEDFQPLLLHFRSNHKVVVHGHAGGKLQACAIDEDPRIGDPEIGPTAFAVVK